MLNSFLFLEEILAVESLWLAVHILIKKDWMRYLRYWRWWIAALLFVTVLVANEIKPLLVERIVYSSKDLIVVREALQYIFLKPEQIPVSTSELSSELLTFSTMERYNKGAVLTYHKPVSVDAFYDGLVVFTGHTKYTGKTMTVLYNEGTTITYGFLDELILLPYTPIYAGQSIGQQQDAFYLQIEQDGHLLNLEEMLAWLKGYG